MKFVSHARTPEELQAEVISDLRRRIYGLDNYIKIVAKNASDKAKLARAAEELIAMLEYWQEVEIVRPKRKRKDISSSAALPHISTGKPQ